MSTPIIPSTYLFQLTHNSQAIPVSYPAPTTTDSVPPPAMTSPISMKWIISYFALWFFLTILADNESTEELAGVLGITVAFSATVILGPKAFSTLSQMVGA